jgi:membrane associated rhomboid family serine protease
MTVMPKTSVSSDPDKFGTVEFYASIGRAFVVMCVVTIGLFGLELLDQATGHHMDRAGGITARSASGLPGIFTAPFLHVSWAHIYGNSIPLLLTGTFVLATGALRFFAVTVLIIVTSGLSVWLFSPPNTVTVGASGVIFGYLGFLFLRGLVERTWWTIAVALLIGLLFGIALSGVVPGDPHISWQAHLGGLVGGLVGAVVFRKHRLPVRPKKQLPTTLTIPTTNLD